MTLRFYLDEDTMRHALVRALRTRGVDVVTALECDLIAQNDEANLEIATAQGRVLYSYNIGDYYRLHTRYLAKNKTHTGIILAPQQRYTVGQQMRYLLKISAALSDRDMRNRLEFISGW